MKKALYGPTPFWMMAPETSGSNFGKGDAQLTSFLSFGQPMTSNDCQGLLVQQLIRGSQPMTFIANQQVANIIHELDMSPKP